MLRRYRTFHLLNKELTFDIDVSAVGCGLNAAVNLNGMPADGGSELFGYAGAAYGTGFCDGQDNATNCVEMDVLEPNSLAIMYTVHPCNETSIASETSICSAYGCGLNPYPLGRQDFYGRGPEYPVDTTKPFTIVTRFVTVDGTDDGDLKEIQQVYIQDGKEIDAPMV